MEEQLELDLRIGGETALAAIPLSVAPDTDTAPSPGPRFTLPRIVDYTIVATFMFFFL